MFLRRLLAAACLFVLFSACDESSPTAPQDETPSGPTDRASGAVFYDENGNGVRDPSEIARVPGTVLSVLGTAVRGTADVASGAVSLLGVPVGRQTVVALEDSLPPFYQANAGVAIDVPPAGPFAFPLTLPIGSNIRHRYLAFGDSITDGDGSSRDQGYRESLAAKLKAHFGRAEIINEGESGTDSMEGADRIEHVMSVHSPAYALIMYGTNDWNAPVCRSAPPCFTVPSLREMVQAARDRRTLPFVASIPPTNTGDSKAPPARNEWVRRMNKEIRLMAAQEGAVYVDAYGALEKDCGGVWSRIMVDHVHFNDRGYEAIANEYFKAISDPRGIATTP
jgi:lysophospholipase L1-like esterase